MFFLVDYKQSNYKHNIVEERAISGQHIPYQKCVLHHLNTYTTYCNRALVLPFDLLEQANRTISLWAQVWNELHPDEDTFVRRTYGQPTLMARFDCIDLFQAERTVENCLRPYKPQAMGVFEIDNRPGGFGTTKIINDQFGMLLAWVASTWPDFPVVLSPIEKWHDDGLWRRTVSLEEAERMDGPLLVRAEPFEREFLRLESRSVSNVRYEGCKAYGVPMGYWEKRYPSDVSRFDFNTNFVLKPLVGYWGQQVYIYTKEKLNGRTTRDGIRKLFDPKDPKFSEGFQEGFYLQKFILPMHPSLEQFGEIDEKGKPIYNHMMYRITCVFNVATEKWQLVGGLWVARPAMKLHGARDAIFGPLVLSL
jgi:hypothetical protein